MYKLRLILAAALAGACFFSSVVCSAEVIEGRAVVMNSDREKARQDARMDAMRSFVEQKTGVNVSSTTEVDKGMVVVDHIVTHSDGYVQINREMDCRYEGDICIVRVDLSAGNKLQDINPDDVKGMLESLSVNSNRAGLQVAVTGRDENGRRMPVNDLTRYVTDILQEKGFQTYVNDEVAAYMDTADLSSMSANAEIRRLSRNTAFEARAILRGTLSVSDVNRAAGGYKATAQASFEIVGFDSNANDVFNDYFSAAAANRTDAIEKAKRMATRAAVDSLARKALRTEQRDTRGGQRHIKTVLVISGITNTAAQPNAIRQMLSSMSGISILRSALTSNGTFNVFVDAVGYDSMEKVKEALINKGLHEGMVNGEAMGANKIYLSY